MDEQTKTALGLTPMQIALSAAGGAAATYHGYKRNKSIGWALLWGAFGGLFPIVTNVIALAQGFGKPKGS